MGFLDIQGYVKRMKILTKKFDLFLEHVLNEHDARRKLEGDSFVPKDIVDLLLQIADDTTLDVKLERHGIKGFTQVLSHLFMSNMRVGEYFQVTNVESKDRLSSDYPIWEVIQKGNGPVQVSTDTNRQIRVLPPKTAEEILARERERKARTTLLMSIPEDHLAKFHKMTDAKEMWEAIKSRFCGNDKSKKMQKYILKQQFESFSVSNSEGLHKGYDRFQSLMSQLEIHGAGVSTEDANQKFLRSLPASWSQVSLIMRTKPGVDTLSFDDLYNNLRVFESDIKGSTASSSITQNVAFVSSESTNNTNDMKKFYKKPRGMAAVELRNQSNGNQESRRRDAGNTGYKEKDNGKRPGKQEEPKALVTLDGDGVDWTGHAEDEQENFALMAHSNSGSNTEVTSCSKECEESYAKLKKLYDEQKEQLGVASIEIQAYTQALKKVEAQLVCHQQNQLIYEEKIRFMKIDLDDKTNVLTYHKKLLAEAVKEKEELKTKLENFQSSFKGLSKLLNSQMSTRDKSGLGVETPDSVPKPVVNEPTTENPSFAFVNTVKHVKTPRETVKEQNTYSPSLKADKRDWNGLMSKKLGLGYGFTKKACFVCGSFSHLIKNCDSQRKEWLTVNTARQNFSGQAATTSTARKVNTARPIVNEIRSRNNFYKSHSPIRRPFNRTTAPKLIFTNLKVNTAEDKTVSVVGGNRKTTVKASADPLARPKSAMAWVPKRSQFLLFDVQDDPQKALKNKGIVDSGCSRHMTGNKAYIVRKYQDNNVGPVALEITKLEKVQAPYLTPQSMEKECENVINEEKSHGMAYKGYRGTVTEGRQVKRLWEQKGGMQWKNQLDCCWKELQLFSYWSERMKELIHKKNKKVAGVHEDRQKTSDESNKESKCKRQTQDLEEEEASKDFFMKLVSEEEGIKDIMLMQRFESTTPEGVDLVLWGDLRTMFDANTEDELFGRIKRNGLLRVGLSMKTV
ncbi:hypothetical protein Tco_0594254 [Tanacetum coccineum]